MHWSERFGQQPSRSWRRFLFGAVLFWLFAIVLVISLEYLTRWQFYMLAAAVLLNFFIACFGYLGILANRIYRLRIQQAKYKDANAKLE